MAMFHVLPAHAAQALGIEPDDLDLPRSEYGIDADALWRDPRFVEIRRQRAAIAAQMAERRHELHIYVEIDRKAAAIIRNHLKCARAEERRRLERERENQLSREERERRKLRRNYMRQRRKERASADALALV
jgi:hypothetical protein